MGRRGVWWNGVANGSGRGSVIVEMRVDVV
jgi:hypothetical protein